MKKKNVPIHNSGNDDFVKTKKVVKDKSSKNFKKNIYDAIEEEDEIESSDWEDASDDDDELDDYSGYNDDDEE